MRPIEISPKYFWSIALAAVILAAATFAWNYHLAAKAQPNAWADSAVAPGTGAFLNAYLYSEECGTHICFECDPQPNKEAEEAQESDHFAITTPDKLTLHDNRQVFLCDKCNKKPVGKLTKTVGRWKAIQLLTARERNDQRDFNRVMSTDLQLLDFRAAGFGNYVAWTQSRRGRKMTALASSK